MDCAERNRLEEKARQTSSDWLDLEQEWMSPNLNPGDFNSKREQVQKAMKACEQAMDEWADHLGNHRCLWR